MLDLRFFTMDGLCLCPLDGAVPKGARPVDEPFAPLAFLTDRDPKRFRGLTALRDERELFEREDMGLLLPPVGEARLNAALAALIHEKGASLVNTAFSNALPVLRRRLLRKKTGFRVELAGLGDVGAELARGLTLLGSGLVDELCIFDPNEKLCARYELELNQLIELTEGERRPLVRVCKEPELFSGDVFIFAATRGVPPLGAEQTDVRLAQWQANRPLVAAYARLARKVGYTGLFVVLSDPVDLLCRDAFLTANKNDLGEFDALGLLPEQIRGFGLGVMRGRAAYYARKAGRDFSTGRVYGPHGAGLVAANALDEDYDDAFSQQLTRLTREANLRVRELGYKPFIAPGLSSGCLSVLRMLRGEAFDATAYFDGLYFGCRVQETALGPLIERRPLPDALMVRLNAAREELAQLCKD